MTEFNLSDKQHMWPWTEFNEKDNLALYIEADVKEFIRRLKEAFPKGSVLVYESQVIHTIVDELAGENFNIQKGG